MNEDLPMPAIANLPALTRDGTKIMSRIHLDQLHKVLAAKVGDLYVRPAFQFAA